MAVWPCHGRTAALPCGPAPQGTTVQPQWPPARGRVPGSTPCPAGSPPWTKLPHTAPPGGRLLRAAGRQREGVSHPSTRAATPSTSKMGPHPYPGPPEAPWLQPQVRALTWPPWLLKPSCCCAQSARERRRSHHTLHRLSQKQPGVRAQHCHAGTHGCPPLSGQHVPGTLGSQVAKGAAQGPASLTTSSSLTDATAMHGQLMSC